MTQDVYDRALGALTGLALGDALGMPTQSMSREAIRTHYGPIRSLRDAVAAQPISPGLPAGTVTDDTEQAVLVARLLIDGEGRIDPKTFAKSLLDWESDMIRRGLADLLGPSTKRALELLEAGVVPSKPGRRAPPTVPPCGSRPSPSPPHRNSTGCSTPWPPRAN